jgi:protein-S-isoprenylcysteine O-methyltransferase Ste14
LDSAPQGPLGQALLVNALLLGLFAVQHSVMARSWFKRWLTRFVPAHLERSTYVLMASLTLILLYWQWQPLGGMVWEVSDPLWRGVLHALFACGWFLILYATFLINHFDLFGLRQVWLNLRGKDYTPLNFGTPGAYKMVRHPIYLGWVVAAWATPSMSITHLFFAVATTAYILVGIRFEERDLVRGHGVTYERYRERVPMLFPFGKRGGRSAGLA